jgi:hypothetical protein
VLQALSVAMRSTAVRSAAVEMIGGLVKLVQVLSLLALLVQKYQY